MKGQRWRNERERFGMAYTPKIVRRLTVKHTLVALVHDRPGVLNRAVSLFRRRGLNIESMTVTRTAREGLSEMTWVVESDDVTPVLAQLEKLIDVLEVHATRTAGLPAGAALTRAVAPSGAAMAQADGVA